MRIFILIFLMALPGSGFSQRLPSLESETGGSMGGGGLEPFLEADVEVLRAKEYEVSKDTFLILQSQLEKLQPSKPLDTEPKTFVIKGPKGEALLIKQRSE